MSSKYLIGIDIGTQGTKTAIYNIEGKLIADAFEESKLLSPSSGVVEQDADEIYNSVTRTTAEVMAKSGIAPSDVLGIGLDGQMAGILGIDKQWNAVTYYDSWLDTRCEKYIQLIKNTAEERVVQITGCQVTYAHGPKILWWKNERPETYKKIEKFVLPHVYAVGKLTGLKSENAYIDYTCLHFSGFGDVKNLCWSQELLDLFGVESSKMPNIVNPWDVMGTLTAEAATLCGLVEGLPVVAGCGDQAATSLAAGVTRKGIIFDVAGTASVFSCSVDEYKPDTLNNTLLFARSIVPELWIPLAYINGGGLCLKWFRDNLSSGISYKQLDQQAAEIAPGSEGLIFSPHFSGRVCPNNPNVRGSWIGLNWVHTRNHLYRSIMESIAYEYNYYLKTLKSLISDIKFSQVYSIGGGSKSKLFNQIKSDVLGVNYVTLNITDTAPLGSAVVAGYGVKVYDDFSKTIDAMVSFGELIQSNNQLHEQYQIPSMAYEAVFKQLAPIYQAIVK